MSFKIQVSSIYPICKKFLCVLQAYDKWTRTLSLDSDIDILEEFAYLKAYNSGQINLDILPISTKALAQ